MDAHRDCVPTVIPVATDYAWKLSFPCGEVRYVPVRDCPSHEPDFNCPACEDNRDPTWLHCVHCGTPCSGGALYDDDEPLCYACDMDKPLPERLSIAPARYGAR